MTLDPSQEIWADPAADPIDLDLPYDRHRDGGSVAIASRYLESVLTLR